MTDVKHPNVTVRLVGEDGNAMNILGRVMSEMHHAHLSAEEVKAYYEEATSGDYNHLLAVTQSYVNVE